jgi:hypothetical protein
MNSAPDSLAGLASGVNNAVARVAGLLWIAAALAATFITRPDRPTPAPRTALIQTPVPHLACPVAFGHVPGQTRRPDSSPTSANQTTVEEASSPE